MINICKHRETRKYSYLGAKKVNIYLVNYEGLTWEIVNVSAGQYEFTLHHHRGKIDFFAASLNERANNAAIMRAQQREPPV